MPSTYTHQFDTPAYKATVTFDTGLFINGEFVQPVDKGTIEWVSSYINRGCLLIMFTRFQCCQSKCESIQRWKCMKVWRILLATGKTICPVSIGNAKDIDIAVKAARAAYKTSWGLKVSGTERGRMLNKFADLIEEHTEELAALESLNVGSYAVYVDCMGVVMTSRYS